MSRKKVFLSLISLVLMSLFSGFVSAAEDEGGLSGVADTVHNLFGFLPNIITLDKLIGEDDAAMFWAKFLIWLLLFAIFYFSAGFVFKDNKRIGTVVALVFALMGTLLIPDSIIINIFQTYGFISGFLIWVIPVAGGFYLVTKTKTKLMKALIYLIMMVVLMSIDSSITSGFGGDLVGNTWYSLFRLLLAVVMIAFIWNLATVWMGGGHDEGHGDHRGINWDWINRGNDRRRDDPDRRRDDRRSGDDPRPPTPPPGDDDEKKVEKAELKILGSFLRILSSLRTYINKTTSRESWEDRFDEEFKRAKEKLVDLGKLERIEIRLEFELEKDLIDEKLDKIGFVKNKKRRENLRVLINQEKHLLKNLVAWVTAVENFRKGHNKAEVVAGLGHMIDITTFLIKINVKELGELK